MYFYLYSFFKSSKQIFVSFWDLISTNIGFPPADMTILTTSKIVNGDNNTSFLLSLIISLNINKSLILLYIMGSHNQCLLI